MRFPSTVQAFILAKAQGGDFAIKHARHEGLHIMYDSQIKSSKKGSEQCMTKKRQALMQRLCMRICHLR